MSNWTHHLSWGRSLLWSLFYIHNRIVHFLLFAKSLALCSASLFLPDTQVEACISAAWLTAGCLPTTSNPTEPPCFHRKPCLISSHSVNNYDEMLHSRPAILQASIKSFLTWDSLFWTNEKPLLTWVSKLIFSGLSAQQRKIVLFDFSQLSQVHPILHGCLWLFIPK